MIIRPDLIIRPFADLGDITVPPQTDASGFVNFQDGYTQFYEISLDSGNPQAKAVERGIQNYLFQALTKNAQAWQNMSRPVWYNTMPGGYDRNAEVIAVDGTGVARPYRSTVSNNSSNPINSATWEYIPTPSEIIANIPMRAGGANGSSNMVLTAPADLNTISNGFYLIATDTVAVGSANAPSSYAGRFEAISWSSGSTTYTLQVYIDRVGNIFIRSSTGAFTPWTQIANVQMVQLGQGQYSVSSGTGAAYVANYVPQITSLVDGLKLKFRAIASSSANATLKVGTTTATRIFTNDLTAVSAGSIAANSTVTVTYSASLAAWVIDSAPGQTCNLTNDEIEIGTNDTKWASIRAVWAAINFAIAGATETKQGTAKIATDALVTAGVDDSTIVSPRKLSKQLQTGTHTFAGGSSGSANVYQANYTPAVSGLVDGMELSFRAHQTNTGPATFSPNGQVARQIFGQAALALEGQEILASTQVTLKYNATLLGWFIVAASGNTQTRTATQPNHAIPLSQFSSLMPSGEVSYFARPTAPPNYLKANGAAISRSAYPELFSAIGTQFGAGNGTTTFNVPDLRGEFIRCWDDGRGVDVNRNFGSAQAAAVVAHTHVASTSIGAISHSHSYSGSTGGGGAHSHNLNIGTNDIATGNPPPITAPGQNSSSISGAISTAPDHTHAFSGTTNTVTQTPTASTTVQSSGVSDGRPRNVALLACIKT